jgi:uncharacterized glyoxalase superfamily protein PhnB
MNEAGPSVAPMLAYEDAATAIDWLTGAFGFRRADGSGFGRG